LTCGDDRAQSCSASGWASPSEPCAKCSARPAPRLPASSSSYALLPVPLSLHKCD
jgi:hypothetical protein